MVDLGGGTAAVEKKLMDVVKQLFLQQRKHAYLFATLMGNKVGFNNVSNKFLATEFLNQGD